ncbi:MAG TPA: ABC transporter permease subunit [Actinomycetota bacterium]|nr:ABC transporter permease subunit [Actinomycetota bacterium]
MSTLVGVELRRLWSRRLFRLLVAGLFATLVVVAVVNGVRSNRNVAAAHARAQQLAAQQANPPAPLLAHCGGNVQVTPEPAGEFKGPIGGPCVWIQPSAQDFYSDPRFSFAGNVGNLVGAAISLAAIIGFVVGAGFIGAEWTAGTFPLLLTWEPRRIRVLAAKALSAIGSFVAVGVVALVVAVGSAWLIAATRGTTAGTTALVWHHVIYDSLRGLLVVALLVGTGVAIAGLARHTSAVLAGAVGYIVIFEIVVRRFHWQWLRWLLLENAGALVAGKTQIFPVHEGPPGLFVNTVYTLHADRAALYLGSLFVAVMVVWAVSMMRRDVDESGRG